MTMTEAGGLPSPAHGRAGLAPAGCAAGCATRFAPAGFALGLPPLPLPPALARGGGLPLGAGAAVFDLTRLVGAAARPFATGIDRIDLAVAEQLLARLGPRCRFALLRRGGICWPHPALARRFLRALAARWRGEPGASPSALALLLRLPGAGRAPAGALYVNAGHGGALRDPAAMARIEGPRPGPRLVYIHDLIPLEAPQTQTAAGRARFDAFLHGLAVRPFHALVNSTDTGRRLLARAGELGLSPLSVHVLRPSPRPLPAAPVPPRAAALLAGRGPLFVALGTVEPRKNHAMLLDIWAGFAADPPPGSAPRLAVLGRRGWADAGLLARLADPPPGVVWLQDASDAEAAALLAHGAGLLAPSLAEGLHLPGREAAALGAPALVADLPAFREGAGPRTRLAPPDDPAAWRDGILRLAAEASGIAARNP